MSHEESENAKMKGNDTKADITAIHSQLREMNKAAEVEAAFTANELQVLLEDAREMHALISNNHTDGEGFTKAKLLATNGPLHVGLLDKIPWDSNDALSVVAWMDYLRQIHEVKGHNEWLGELLDRLWSGNANQLAILEANKGFPTATHQGAIDTATRLHNEMYKDNIRRSLSSAPPHPLPGMCAVLPPNNMMIASDEAWAEAKLMEASIRRQQISGGLPPNPFMNLGEASPTRLRHQPTLDTTITKEATPNDATGHRLRAIEAATAFLLSPGQNNVDTVMCDALRVPPSNPVVNSSSTGGYLAAIKALILTQPTPNPNPGFTLF